MGATTRKSLMKEIPVKNNSSLRDIVWCVPSAVESSGGGDDDDDLTIASADTNSLHSALADFATQSLSEDARELESRLLKLIDLWPDAVRLFDRKGMCPLHVACKEGASLEVIHRLVQAWPDSIQTRTRNKSKLLPLHLACQYYSGPKKFQLLVFLIRSFPEAVEIPTSNTGDLPLHLCLRNYFCTLPELLLLAERYPPAVKIQNSVARELPIHVALGRRYMQQLERKSRHRHKRHGSAIDDHEPPTDVNFAILQYLMRSHPQSLSSRNGMGELPLHVAVRSYQPPAMVECVRMSFPSATRCVDDHGRTPLHLAVSRIDPNLDTIQLLLRNDPACAMVRDANGKIPLEYVTRAAGSLHFDLHIIASVPKVHSSKLIDRGKMLSLRVKFPSLKQQD